MDPRLTKDITKKKKMERRAGLREKEGSAVIRLCEPVAI
jgi:hypothetical protein